MLQPQILFIEHKYLLFIIAKFNEQMIKTKRFFFSEFCHYLSFINKIFYFELKST